MTSANLRSKALPEADKAYFQYLSRELRQLIALDFDPAQAQSYHARSPPICPVSCDQSR